jgi:hypothetical protein
MKFILEYYRELFCRGVSKIETLFMREDEGRDEFRVYTVYRDSTGKTLEATLAAFERDGFFALGFRETWDGGR